LKAKDWYNIIFRSYDTLYKDEQIQKVNFIISTFRKYINSKLENGLDYGCGTGFSIRIIKEFCNKTFAYDISENMVKIAKKKHPEVIYIDRLTEKYNEFFDLISCITVLQDSENPKEDINNIYRILKPRGYIIISVLKRSNSREYWKSLLNDKFEILLEEEEKKDYILIGKKL